MAPSLIIPQQLQDFTVFSLKDKNPRILNNYVDVADSFRQDFRCVGSSHGWLAFTQENSDKPFLLNPFSKARICLPSFPAGSKIDKIVLCGDPSHDDNYTVVAMHSAWLRTKIAFCRRGNDKWSDFGSEMDTCYDIVCCDVTRSAFALGPGPKVEVWDLSGDVPSWKTLIQGSIPSKLARDDEIFPRDLYSSQWYLALSGTGQMFLVVRYIGEFVRYDGAVVYEGDTLTDYASEPLVCPYKTLGFHVFKYDHGKKWVEVDSLDQDCALFLGGNQSMMVKDGEVKGNAIYFTDDNWDRMEEDYSYGGHDSGIFNMQDGSIHPLLESREPRIVPPPMWIHDVSNV